MSSRRANIREVQIKEHGINTLHSISNLKKKIDPRIIPTKINLKLEYLIPNMLSSLSKKSKDN